ncbi:cupin [Desulfonema ishimotonii]|uniref:Cupin n=1 Tax=Desulfonema ishimotonii TaxID=45657 RepID=A0A401FTD3_9BACT|nr:cupin domain-containing protein [Desulfonema ishimotonii]GBC60218.1 cupin [Desulfonema ishimotonii]
MKIIHYSEIAPRSYNGDAVKGVSGRVAIGSADGAANFCMRVFELAPDGFTPRHSHEWEHEVFFHAGRGDVWQDGKWIPVEAGCTVFIPGNEEHQIRNAGDDKLVFVCLIPAGVPEL